MYIEDRLNIEDVPKKSIVDFANKHLGGGVLENGCVQEEIIFALMPEMLVSLILVESLKDNESITFTDIVKYSNSKGYSDSFQYTSYCQEKFIKEIIAIDAIDFNKYVYNQYDKKSIDREIQKAYTGFFNTKEQTIVTGNWGCGAFKGDHQLKFLIQWIAASIAGKSIVYCTQKESSLKHIKNVIDRICKMSTFQVYQKLISTNGNVFDAILQQQQNSSYKSQQYQQQNKNFNNLYIRK